MRPFNLTERICKDCGILMPMDKYYKRTATAYYTRCKECMLSKKRKPEGHKRVYKSRVLPKFYEIPPEKMDEIDKAIKVYNSSLHHISKMFDINYNHLLQWRRAGLI